MKSQILGFILLAGTGTWAYAATSHHDAARAVQERCRQSRQIAVTMDAHGLPQLELNARAGSLRVQGGDGTSIQARGTVCASSADLAGDAMLRSDHGGGTARLNVELPSTRGTAYVRMDLVVEMPRGMTLKLDDSSGDLSVDDVAAVTVNDGSGGLRLSNIGGDVDVDDGSGDIEIRDITGDVRVRDSSGDIHIRRVHGAVTIPDDGSGDIRVADVERDVLVRNDGSGDIVAAGVGGDFTVEHDGSGD
ncbi:MAG TPA: DUF4097 family beta strand repeat-containing protein, partial [Longimicrobiales bacterium]|nr:DUF4097 family beta strand repeat-containing protein [Longimicrobiales bacterium]